VNRRRNGKQHQPNLGKQSKDGNHHNPVRSERIKTGKQERGTDGIGHVGNAGKEVFVGSGPMTAQEKTPGAIPPSV
jgi:hypothetical protein